MTPASVADARDSAERKELGALLDLASRAAGVAVAQQDRDLRYTRVHDAGSPERADIILGMRDDEIIDDPVEGERVLSAKRRVLESGRGETLVATPANGTATAREILLEPLHDDRGEVVGVLSAHGAPEVRWKAARLDRRAGASLGHRFEDLLDQTTAYVYVKDLEGRYTLASRGFQMLFGRDVIGLTDFDLIPRRWAEQWQANDRRASETLAPVEVEESDGQTTFLSVRMPLLDGRGTAYAICGFSSDITTYKRMTERLFSTQRLESLGQLAGGVAHDFNNLLTVIDNFSAYLLDRAADVQTRSDLQAIQGAVRRGAELTRHLLLFSGGRPAQKPKAASVGEALKNVERLLRPTLGKQIEIEFRGEAAGLSVAAESIELEQILMNLALNARDAMPDGGRMLTAADVPSASELEADAPELDTGRSYVRLSVEDTGVGMSAAHAARALEPFFTTKAEGEGTGLGLASVYGIAKQSGGTATIDSAEGRGTRVCAYLPTIAARGADGEGSQTPARPALGAVPTVVLLIEDDDDLREGITRMLSRAGYAVIPVADGEECLRVLAGSDMQVDVALVDLDLPGMPSAPVKRRIREQAPHVPIVHMSGSADSGGPEPFVEKPVGPDRLVAVIDNAVRRAAPP